MKTNKSKKSETKTLEPKPLQYRLVKTNWTGKEAWKGEMIKVGTVIDVSPKDLKDQGLVKRLENFFELIGEVEPKKETIIGSETIESSPIKLIDNKEE